MKQVAVERPGFLARLFSWPLEVLVRAYQLLLSPLLPRSCRYYPSCSAYALESLRRFGVLRGTWLGARRLGRCHPWCAGGVDHVPPRRSDGRPDWEAHRTQAERREAEWAQLGDDVQQGIGEQQAVFPCTCVSSESHPGRKSVPDDEGTGRSAHMRRGMH
ncbi:membrane protein insertion efficiency factor YidD [Austwickia chelonae]|uniref:membrane protein insertion efficiency factor YidD n=1 Tax=Austwickia chelonae TaxID=100225 RepID=UPI000E2718E3